MNKTFSRFFLSFLLLVSIFSVSLPHAAYAQTSMQTQLTTDLQTRLAAIEQKTEARRKELGIPGMSLAIVKDGEVIYAKGFGYKDFEKKIAVTADTQFAIGSATKAFTALSILMSQEQGKLNLDDSPKKYLSYFKINNADTDARITIRDLLSHSSGLNRTDLAMITGKLTREELIRVAGEAKPTAGLREKFQYQNIMFAAAGEIVAQVQKQSWESFVEDKIFKPLGMTNSTLTLEKMQKAKDFSLGYDYNFDTKETRQLPMRDILQVAPAGAINSSANDMSKWLKFMLAGGELNGKRLVSENLFAELEKPQMKVGGKTSYGLGWFLQDWNGLKVVQHGGNIDGFNSMVAMIPEKKLGFVMLTNVSGSTLGNELMPIVWDSILGEKKADESIKLPIKTMEKMVGKYHLAEAGIDIEVKIENENLVMLVPGQPTYTLQRTGERQFKVAGAPDGFAVKFTPAQGDATEMYLQQPQGNYTLPRVNADAATAKTETLSTINPASELIGKYQPPNNNGVIEVKEVDGKISLVVPGQPPYELKQKEKDVFNSPMLPDAYSVKVKRTTDGKIEGIVLIQPEGEFPLKLIEAGTVTATLKTTVTADEVMTKTIAALGGEANWRKITSREMKFEIDFVHQGVKGYGTARRKSPNLFVTDTTFTALGKPIATDFEYFDGTSGGEVLSFSPAEAYTGKRLEDIKLENDFYGILDWKNGIKSAEVKGIEKVGDEDAYIIVFQPENASEYTYFVSTKTFLPLKRTGIIVSSTSSVKQAITQIFSDYRPVDGVLLPFKTTVISPSMGDVVTYIKEVKQNVALADSMFRPKEKK
ncbi:MAG TPA: serine hydrolase [Pyrinomonadaceae bacterium]